MAISLIGASTVASTSITIPGTYQAGDFIIIMAFRTGSTSVPALGSGFISMGTNGANTCSVRIGYKIATSSSETSGTWTNATSIVCQVYRGVGAIGMPVNSNGNGSTITFATLTMLNTDGNSWVVGMAAHRDSGSDLSIAPTGMTNRAFMNTGAGGHIGGNDTNGGVSSWSSQNVAVGGVAAGWETYTLELIPTGYIVRRSEQDARGTSATTSVSATYTNPTVAGNMLLCTVFSNVGFASVTLPTGFTLASDQDFDVGIRNVLIAYKIADGTETTITASATLATVMKIHIYEYVGLANPVVLDGTNGATSGASTVTTINSGNVTTANANDLLFISGATNAATTAQTFDGGFSIRQVDASGIRLFDADQVVAATGTYSSNASWTTSSAAGITFSTFKGASGSPPATTAAPTHMMMGYGV